MKKTTRTKLFQTALALVLVAGFWLDAVAGDETGLEVWNDPQFQREFLGSFGVNAEIEPGVNSAEYETMQEILPLLGTDSAAAIARVTSVRTIPAFRKAARVLRIRLANRDPKDP